MVFIIHINFLSVDIDYNDFYVLRQVLKFYDVDVVCCEYNATLGPNDDKVVLYKPEHMWDHTEYFGASLEALNNMMRKLGYKLIYCDNNGVNAFFVKKCVLGHVKFLHQGDVDKIYKPRHFRHREDSCKRPFVDSNMAMTLGNKIVKFPKNIYMCYKNKHQLREKKAKWEALNPEYTVHLFDDCDCKRFIRENYSEYLDELYDLIEDGNVKADLWRVCILSKLGGVYVDADIDPIIPIDYFVEDDVDFLTASSYWGETYNPDIIIAMPCDRILERCVGAYLDKLSEKIPYSYWAYCLKEILRNAMHTEYIKEGFHFSKDNKKIQIISEDAGTTVRGQDLHKYKDVVIFRNRTDDWDHEHHCFRNPEITYNTKYGKVTLLRNEAIVGEPFRHGRYWDDETLCKLKHYIPKHRNILEIGAHCGTSSLFYAKCIDDEHKVYAYEPQSKMYELLCKNIQQNELADRIVPYQVALFCYEGRACMSDYDLDCNASVSERLHSETELPCNFAGTLLGRGGEEVKCTTLNSLDHENIGFIHCDAQGAENFIFSCGKRFIGKHRPVIYFENAQEYGHPVYEGVRLAYPEHEFHAKFDLINFCVEHLEYRVIRHFGAIDDLLVPIEIDILPDPVNLDA